MPVLILAFSLFLIYVLTRKVIVLITKEDKWRVEISFTLLGIHFNKLLNRKKRKKEQKKDGKRAGGKQIYGRIMKSLGHAELEIRHLNLPIFEGVLGKDKILLSQFGYHALVGAFLAFLNSKAKKLTVSDNAITLYSDGNYLFLDASVTARLFHVLSTLTLIWIDEKRRKRKLRCQKIK